MVGNRCATMMVGGYRYTLCISTEYEVYSFGTNGEGAHGFSTNHPLPLQKIPCLVNIKGIACGDHTVCLDFDGNVYTFGGNKSGQLGIGLSVDSTHEPQKLSNLPPIKQISCGRNFTMCVSEEGDVYSFGDNTDGKLGLDDFANCGFPKKIESLCNVDFVECGDDFTFCKTLSNDIYGWGYNDNGELGFGSRQKQVKPYHITNWPDDVVDIKCGLRHTLVLTSIQEVYSCGANNSGQLGLLNVGTGVYCDKLTKIDEIEEIVRIECGYYHSMCIDINNILYVFGENSSGELGLGDGEKRRAPVQHPTLSKVIDISSGGNQSFVKTSNNEIFAFGWNAHQQLGIKTERESQLLPIQIFQENEDVWRTSISNSRAKSARK